AGLRHRDREVVQHHVVSTGQGPTSEVAEVADRGLELTADGDGRPLGQVVELPDDRVRSPLHQDEQFVGVGGGITAAYGHGQVRVRDGDRTVHQDLIVSGARRRTLQFGGEGAGRLQNQVSGDREGAGGAGRARGEGAGGADGHRALDRSGAAEGLVGGE